MYNIDKCILVTNNDKAADKWNGIMQEVLLLDTYRDVLVKARDMIYEKYELLTHPQTSSLKPNQTPYKTIILYAEKREADSRNGNFRDIELIESAIDNFDKWNSIRKTPKCTESIANDYKTIDVSMIENVVSRL